MSELKLIKSEEDFITEGMIMKNCMSKQFVNGMFSIFLSMKLNRRRINLQYRKGKLVQAYSKANSPINEDIFKNYLIDNL